MAVTTVERVFSYRRTKPEDLELLLQYRVECGWGELKTREGWVNPDWVYYIFTVQHFGESQLEDVGMAALVLDKEDDQETASREDGVVHIASLFVRKQHQGFSYGTQAMSILERLAKSIYNAKAVTLDTSAYQTETSEDGTYWIENFDEENRTIDWYRKKGYVQYRAAAPSFFSPTPADPTRKLYGLFMKKDAGLIP